MMLCRDKRSDLSTRFERSNLNTAPEMMSDDDSAEKHNNPGVRNFNEAARFFGDLSGASSPRAGIDASPFGLPKYKYSTRNHMYGVGASTAASREVRTKSYDQHGGLGSLMDSIGTARSN